MNATISARDAADLQSLKGKYGLELIQAKPEDLKKLNRRHAELLGRVGHSRALTASQ